MNKPRAYFDQLDERIIAQMAGYGITLLRLSVGLVFLWFGFLKFIPGLSPAEELATKTVDGLSFGLVPHVLRPQISVFSTDIALRFGKTVDDYSDK